VCPRPQPASLQLATNTARRAWRSGLQAHALGALAWPSLRLLVRRDCDAPICCDTRRLLFTSTRLRSNGPRTVAGRVIWPLSPFRPLQHPSWASTGDARMGSLAGCQVASTSSSSPALPLALRPRRHLKGGILRRLWPISQAVTMPRRAILRAIPLDHASQLRHPLSARDTLHLQPPPAVCVCVCVCICVVCGVNKCRKSASALAENDANGACSLQRAAGERGEGELRMAGQRQAASAAHMS
ncbi:hypothetical protein T440DRAFT_529696, partial [Plenodomus tracheiphilus IPT5]